MLASSKSPQLSPTLPPPPPPRLPSCSWKLFWGMSASHGPLSDQDDDVALLSVEMEPGEIIISAAALCESGVGGGGQAGGTQDPTKPSPLSWPGSADTDGDTAILSLSVETAAPPPGQRHVGVVSTNLQWALKHLVAEPVVERRKAVLGED